MKRQVAIGLTLVAVGIALMAQNAKADELLTTLYGDGTDGYAGQSTASGDVCCPGYTAASGVYPMGTVLEACYNGCVAVEVNDLCACGLDLSPTAASAIGIDVYGPDVTEVTVL